MDDIQEALKRPFETSEIEWRVQQSGVKDSKPWAMVLAYVTNRAVMDRLDEVFGVAGWKNEFSPTPGIDGVMCGISIKSGNEWVTKYDGAANTDVEAVKGGLSSAMKRTAVQFGIGRYLYHLETGFANIQERKSAKTLSGQAKDKDNGHKVVYFNYIPPELPPFALPISKSQMKIIEQDLVRTGTVEEKMLTHFKLCNINNATSQNALDMISMLGKKKSVEKEEEKQ